MAGISSLGVGSGLDLGTLVQRLVSAERSPGDARLNRSKSRMDAQVSALGQLQSGLSRLDDALKKLSELSVGRTVQVSDSKALSATATAAADLGKYSIEVFELARAQSLASTGFADPDAALGSGTLTLAVGDGEPVTITIEEGQDSLRAVRDAINAADAGVQATLVRDGAEWRLLLNSQQTGVENTISLTASAGLDARLESAAMEQTVAAADARFSVSGLELTSASNVVEDVLPGVTLTLKAPSEAPLTLTVGQDEQTVRTAVNAFVTAYNAVIDLVGNLSRYNPETQQGSALTGDATARSVRAALPAAIGAATGAQWNMVELGIRSDLNGKISLDAEAFNARLAENPGEVLAGLNGFGEALGTTVRGFSGTEGLIKDRTDSLKASLRSLTLQREALDRRMESYEQRLVRQFTALDQMVSQLQSTSSFLGTQLASIANLTVPRR